MNYTKEQISEIIISKHAVQINGLGSVSLSVSGSLDWGVSVR